MGGLRLANLLNDPSTLGPLLQGEVEAGRWLDAFLLAAGIDQVLEDALHEDPFELDRVAGHLKGAAAGAARAAAATLWAVRGARRRPVERCRRLSQAVVSRLADALVPGRGDVDVDGIRTGAARIARLIARLPARVRRDPIRMPSCFRTFDQRPEDMGRLARDASARWPERGRPVLVVGLRTSGSYLAPLMAAHLQALGHESVAWMTCRPGQRWLRHEARRLRAAAADRALVFLVDDPPKSWESVAKTARELGRFGIERGRMALVLQALASTPQAPADLADHPAVIMPWEAWSIHRLLEPEAIADALDALGAGRGRPLVVPLPSGKDPNARGHVRTAYRAQWPDMTRTICARGVGLGYLGTHSLLVSDALAEFTPPTYGVREGLLFREWLPETARVAESDSALARRTVEYVMARCRAFPVDEDVSLRLRRRGAVWQLVGKLLSRAFGRGHLFTLPLTEAIARSLLPVARPSVVDGSTSPGAWFRTGVGLRKIGIDEHAFSSRDVYCYDPVFDLAGAAAGTESEELDRQLRRLYTASGGVVSPERWLLYQLLQLEELPRRSAVEVERAMSRRLQRYVSELFFDDVESGGTGPLCAIDIDGVLEASALGFTGTSPAGALALRSLLAHGFRPVIATGRSLDEVRERCRSYRLPGGVAEYGAAVYVADGDTARGLLTDAQRTALGALRARLAALPGVRVDDVYGFAVRASRLDGRGRRRGLSEETLAGLGGDSAIRAIRGIAQTDFMVAGVDKATGLRALAADMGADPDGLAFAAGDTVSDLEMLRTARLGFAPGNADASLRAAGVTVLRGHCQAGLEAGVARLLGHRPGACPRCRLPRLSPDSRLLLAVLRAPEHQGPAGRLAHLAGTALELAVRSRPHPARTASPELGVRPATRA
jgi:hypothetical protein